MQLRHAWLHLCVYDRLYHSRHNDRDTDSNGLLVRPLNKAYYVSIGISWTYVVYVCVYLSRTNFQLFVLVACSIFRQKLPC